jgi:hypothetical protein
MEWVLIITVWFSTAQGGAHVVVTPIEGFASKVYCEAAREEYLEATNGAGGYVGSRAATAACVQLR